MALDERYIVSSDIEQYYVDKDDGLPLANGTLTFYRDIARNVPKEVFQLSGAPPNYTYTSMGAQITLSAVGTVQNSGGDNEVIYYYPYDTQGNLDLYYIVVRDQNGIEQFTREAWPNVTSGSDPSKDQTSLQNQISNPTFTNVLINDGKTTVYTVTSANNQVFEFAPNWDFVISGTGSVTVQRIAITGNEKLPTSPPYVIDVTVSVGITSCLLRQRFNYNSGLWSSTPNNPIFLSGSFVARNESVGTTGLQMYYVESSGGSPILIVDGAFQSTYTLITGSTASQIPQSSDTNSGKNGYVDIYLSFITNSHVRVSAIQVIPTASSSINIVPYDTNSSNREEALQGDYYIPRLVQKSVPSFLVGWDFPLNPFQFGLTGNIAATAAYIADQTIALRGATGTVAWAQSAVAGLQFTTSGTNDAFYLLQYLSGAEVKNMLAKRLSVNVFGYQGTIGDASTIRVYLYRGNAAATVPTLPTTIGTLAATGVFTLTAANWTEIPRSGLDTAQATISKIATNADVNDGNNDYGFSGWEIVDAAQIADTDKFAIVVTFHYPDTNSVITVNSISLIPGDLPCRPSPKTKDDVLRECRYYYEKTYPLSTQPGAITGSGALILDTSLVFIGGSDYVLYAKSFTTRFMSPKRISTATVTFYSPSVPDVNVILFIVRQNTGPTTLTTNVPTSAWQLLEQTIDIINLQALNDTRYITYTGSPEFVEASYQFHYVVDARLGIV